MQTKHLTLVYKLPYDLPSSHLSNLPIHLPPVYPAPSILPFESAKFIPAQGILPLTHTKNKTTTKVS